MERESITNTIIVAGGVCLVCATLVSVAAVGLRDAQTYNKLLDKKRNILLAAFGEKRTRMMLETASVSEIFNKRFIDRIIDLETGQDVTNEYPNPGEFDQVDAAESGDPQLSDRLKDDPATIKTREKRSHVYIVKTSESDETPLMYVFPIRGKGLWSILKGFIALDADLQTIRGITYYEHAETPGLGGEVDDPEWKSHWVGSEGEWVDKRLFDENGDVAIKLVKTDWKNDPHQIDALSGATITGRGVEKMLKFWMGEQGFGPFLQTLEPRIHANSVGASDAGGSMNSAVQPRQKSGASDG